MIEIVLEKKAISKKPPRFARGFFYAAKEVRKYEEEIKKELLQYKRKALSILSREAGKKVEVLFFFKSKKRNNSLHNRKPDIDNLLKSIFDAIKGVLIEDDALICEVYAKKQYSDKDKIIIRIEDINGNEIQ